MTRFRAACLAAGALLLAAMPARAGVALVEKDLLGHWACKMSIEGEHATSDAELEYLKDGTLSARLSVTMTDQSGSLTIVMAVLGEWRVAPGGLIEKVTDTRVLSFDPGTGSQPWSEAPPELRDAVESGMGQAVGVESPSNIVELTPTTLKMREPDTGQDIDCTRP